MTDRDAATGADTDASHDAGSDAPPDTDPDAGSDTAGSSPGTPGGRPGRPAVANLLEALSVRRNAAVGLVVGVSVAVTAYSVRVFELLGPAAGQDAVGGPVLFALLAFVLAFGTFVLVTFVLTLGSAYRRTRDR